MNNLKISIVVPVFQTKEWIKKCVDSLIRQTYKNIEILLINDGSSDGSEIICEEYSKKYSNIKTIHQENKGVGAARNTGICHASGEYIMFVDSDDFISPYTIERLITIVDKEKLDIIFFDYIKVYDKQKIKITAKIDEGLYSKEKFASVFLKLVETNIANNIGTKLYNTEFIKQNNLLFTESYNITEDILFCLNATRYSGYVYYLKEGLYFYNIRQSGSLMSSYKEGYYEAERELYQNIKEYLIEHNQFYKHAEEYYSLYMNVIMTVLINEIDFNKDSKELFIKIIKDQNVSDAKVYLQGLTLKKKIIYNLIWKKKFQILNYLLKVYANFKQV